MLGLQSVLHYGWQPTDGVVELSSCGQQSADDGQRSGAADHLHHPRPGRHQRRLRASFRPRSGPLFIYLFKKIEFANFTY